LGLREDIGRVKNLISAILKVFLVIFLVILEEDSTYCMVAREMDAS